MSAVAEMTSAEMPSVQKYFIGILHRDDETPEIILDVCWHWYASRKSAMYRFHKGEIVKPSALVREASQALSENNLGEREEERLRQLQTWASRKQALCKAAQDLRDAHDAFQKAVKSLNLDPYAAEEIRRVACWDGK